MRDAGVAILAESGLRVLHEQAREAAAWAGLRVSGDRVLPCRSAIDEFLAESASAGAERANEEAPAESSFRIHTCQYPTHVHDLDTDTVVPYTADRLVEAARLVDALSEVGVVGGAPGCPGDAPGHLQPILQYKIQAQHCRHGRTPVDPKWAKSLPYVMEMADVLDHPILSLPVYVVSPLTIGAESLESVMSVAHRLERVSTSNMPSVGATTPVRVADALALGVAEVVGSAIVLRAVTELPVDWSVGAMAFDLRGMAMSFGGPEHQLFRWAAQELNAFCHGRQLGVPSGWASMRTQAKLPGPQAAAEKMAGAVLAAVFGSRDLDGGGTLSLDEVFSAEQLIIDCELRDHVARLVSGIDGECDAEACAREVAAGLDGGFLGLDSTLSQYQSVYWLPRVFERRSLAGWLGAGAPDVHDRAKEMAREYAARHDYELPSDLSRELGAIYSRAEKELAGLVD
jgi:trimethylamine:corrinoid methyltransferase-like protein